MIGAPGAFETEIQIAQRAGERDSADVSVSAARRGRLDDRERAGDLAALIFYPLGAAHFRLAPCLFVAQQQRRVADPVRERLQPEHVKPTRAGRNEAPASGEMVEIFDDDAAVEEHAAVLQHQRGDLAERVFRADAVRGVGRVRGDGFDAPAKPYKIGGDPNLADIGGCGGGSKDHHLRRLSCARRPVPGLPGAV